jgi:hypothetical protein
MAALLLLLLVTMGLHHWVTGPLLLSGTWLLQGSWIPALALVVLVWLLAGRR